MTVLPNFVVIGASRCGTTSLHDYLDQHPEVFVTPRKSPNYFVSRDAQPKRENDVLKAMARQWISTREAYEAQFQGVDGERAIGDVSPVYMQSVHTAQRIREALGPATRIMAILRHPADRAHAHFLGRRRDGLEPVADFAAVVERELAMPLDDEIAFGSYLACSRYHHFLRPYYDLFPSGNLRIYRFEQLRDDPPALLRDLFAFLGVNPDQAIDTSFIHNRSGEISNSLLRNLWTGSVRLRTALRPYLPGVIRHAPRALLSRQVAKAHLDGQLRGKICTALREDMEKLQRLSGLDVSDWLLADPDRHA